MEMVATWSLIFRRIIAWPFSVHEVQTYFYGISCVLNPFRAILGCSRAKTKMTATLVVDDSSISDFFAFSSDGEDITIIACSSYLRIISLRSFVDFANQASLPRWVQFDLPTYKYHNPSSWHDPLHRSRSRKDTSHGGSRGRQRWRSGVLYFYREGMPKGTFMTRLCKENLRCVAKDS